MYGIMLRFRWRIFLKRFSSLLFLYYSILTCFVKLRYAQRFLFYRLPIFYVFLSFFPSEWIKFPNILPYYILVHGFPEAFFLFFFCYKVIECYIVHIAGIGIVEKFNMQRWLRTNDKMKSIVWLYSCWNEAKNNLVTICNPIVFSCTVWE